MPIFNAPNQSIRWLMAELMVVVLGILMAISIDAWWNEIGDRRSEQALLQALGDEFEKNQELLNRRFDIYHRRSSAASALLSLGPDATNLEPDLLNSHWRWVIRGGTYNPSTGVLDAAVSSGNITVLRDPDLRLALARWPGHVKSLANVENRIDNLIFDQMVPWIRLQTALPDDSFGETGIPKASSEIDFDLLSSSTVIENFLREEVAWDRVLDKQMENLNEAIALIQTCIERNLNNK